MKNKNLKKVFAVILSAITMLTAFASCANHGESAENALAENVNGAFGKVLISVNPSIELEYDRDGKVIEIEGKNDDGKEVVEGYTEYAGKDAKTVAAEIVKLIYDGGFFENTIDGRAKNVVVKLEDGSRYPGDTFLTDVANSIKTTVEECGITTGALVVDEDELDGKGFISADKAKEIAESQMGVSGAVYTECELDDGVYELEFELDGAEYEVDVNAYTGSVIKAEAEYENKGDGESAEVIIPQEKQKISRERAIELAFAHFGVKAEACRDIECELDDGKYEIEFECADKEYEVDIDLWTGAASDAEIDTDDDDDDDDDDTADKAPAQKQKISRERAMEIAFGYFGVKAADCRDLECELDDGKYELEFECGAKEYEIDVDVWTGAVSEAEVELDDDYDDDDDDDIDD